LDGKSKVGPIPGFGKSKSNWQILQDELRATDDRFFSINPIESSGPQARKLSAQDVRPCFFLFLFLFLFFLFFPDIFLPFFLTRAEKG
jgi:hypothetical protein